MVEKCELLLLLLLLGGMDETQKLFETYLNVFDLFIDYLYGSTTKFPSFIIMLFRKQGFNYLLGSIMLLIILQIQITSSFI